MSVVYVFIYLVLILSVQQQFKYLVLLSISILWVIRSRHQNNKIMTVNITIFRTSAVIFIYNQYIIKYVTCNNYELVQ